MRYRSKSTRKHSYVRSGGGRTVKTTYGTTATGTKYRATSVNPMPTTTEYTSEQSPTFSIGTPSGGGSPGIVFILASTLFVVATWDGYGQYVFHTLIDGSDFKPVIPFPMMVGGVVFIIILSAISEADDSNLALYMVLGLWLLYILFYGQKTWQSIWGWLGGYSGIGNIGQPLGPSSTTSLTSLFKKATPLPDTSGAATQTGAYQGTPVQNATVPKGTVLL